MPLHGRISGSASVNGALQGSGTTDYNELNNKPKINNITLSGNKTSADLGLQDAISFPGDSSKYLDGSGNFSTPAGGSSDYEDLSNKPSINGVTLDGDNTSMSLGLEPAITYVGVDSMFYDGSGNFDYVSYNEVTDKPSINSHVISGNMSDSDLDINYENLNYLPMINNVTLTGDKTADDLGLQDKIIYPEDSTLFLDGEGNFRLPDYFSGDYDDLTDKPEINGITLEGDKSGNELELTSGPIASGTGTSVNFTSEGAYNLLKCVVEFEPIQSGSGTPSPDNPRPISGYSSITINVSPSVDPSEGTDYIVNLNGTYYRGTLDAINGKLIITDRYFTVDTVSFYGNPYGHDLYSCAIPDYDTQPIKRYANRNDDARIICNMFLKSTGSTNSNMPDLEFRTRAVTDPDIIYINYDAIGSAADFNTLLSNTPMQFCAELVNPFSINIDKEVIDSLIGENYVTASGMTISVDSASEIYDPVIEYLVRHR